MSARQNKKRGKGRSNANNRERTVITLTEDPNTPYLVPTPSEEPRGAALMSSSFSVASSATGNPNQQHQFYPPQQQSQVILPQGKNDLEILEKLKEMIKSGQHEFYRPVPQPAALASIYLDPSGQTKPINISTDSGPQPTNNTNQGPHGHNTRYQDDDASGVTPPNLEKPNIPVPLLAEGKDDLRPRENGWSGDHAPVSDDRRRDSDRRPPSPGPPRPATNGSSDTRLNDRVPPRDDRYYDRDRDRDYRDRRDWDRDRRPYDNRFRDARMTDLRRPPPEQRHYEPDYDRQPIPRRYDGKGADEPPLQSRRPSDVRGPAPPASIPDRGVTRAPPAPDDRFSSARPASDDNRPPITNTRLSHPDSRVPLPDSRAPPSDNRPGREPSFDDRQLKPALSEIRRDSVIPANERPSVPVARPADLPASSRPVDDRAGVRPPPIPAVEDRNSRPQVPLEERIGRPSLQERLSQPPTAVPEATHVNRQASLEERISHVPVSTDSRDQRPSRPPVLPDRDRANTRSGQLDEHPVSRPAPPLQDDRRFVRGVTPVFDRPSRASYPPPQSASDMRDDPRGIKPAPSPPRSVSRDYRRPLSRERVDARPNNYRPDERVYEDRRPDAMDVDKYGDRGAGPYRPFSPPSAADLARDRARLQFPPSPASPARLPVPAVDGHGPPYDDRRYSGRDWQYPPYSDRRREWSAAADDDYYRSRTQWERGAPPPPPSSSLERERFERDAAPPLPPPHLRHWEPRDDRERRDNYPRAGSPPPPPPPPRASYDGPPSQAPPPRSLSSRLTDSYGSGPPAGGERSYVPPPPPPGTYSRVRQRSVSPVRRVDDSRPPMKRPRDVAYGAEFYPGGRPEGGPPPPPPASVGRARPGEYPPPVSQRSGSPPPPGSGGSGYFDGRGGPPPPSSGGTVVSGGDRERERERERERGEYPPPPPSSGREYVGNYERPRSPGRGYGRGGGGGYVGRDERRDDRRYVPPPPPPPGIMARRP